MSFVTPASPKHPEADEEIRDFPTGQLDIGLNPDLDDEDDESIDDQDDGDKEGGFVRATTSKSITPANVSANGIKGSSLAQLNQRAAKEYEEASSATGMEVVEETEDLQFPSITATFEHEYEIVKAEFQSHSTMSSSQQSNLVNYLDEELLKVQRRFIKTQSGEVRSSLEDIIRPLYTHGKVIWLSISREFSNNVEYFIKILADLEDYLDFFIFPEESNKLLFEFLQFLDVRLSFLYDTKVCSSTQFVRVLSIVPRLRVTVVDKFSTKSSSVVELEVSKLFEGILDRS